VESPTASPTSSQTPHFTDVFRVTDDFIKRAPAHVEACAKLHAPAVRERIAAAATLSNSPQATLTPELEQALTSIAQKKTPVSVRTYLPHEINGTRVIQYTVNDNQPDAIRSFSYEGQTHEHLMPDDFHNIADFVPGEGGFIALRAENAENVVISSEKDGMRSITYAYQSLTWGYQQKTFDNIQYGGRPSLILKIAVQFPSAEAAKYFAALRQNPEAARAFFIAASHDVPKVDFVWKENPPHYRISDDGYRHLLFVDEAAHTTRHQSVMQPGAQALEYEYVVKDGQNWKTGTLPQETQKRLQMKQKEYLRDVDRWKRRK